MILVDANIAIAVLNPHDVFHDPVAEWVAEADEPLGLTSVTLAECLVRPAIAGVDDEAAAVLDRLFDPVDVDRAIVRRAARLRADVAAAGYSARRLLMMDAFVVAAAIELDATVMTTDREWPLDVIGDELVTCL